MTTYIKNILRDNRYFLIPFAVIWCVALIFSMMHSKAETHLIINQLHAPWADTFFKYFTEAGGWFPWVIIGLTLFTFRLKDFFVLLSSQLVATVITTPLKHIFNVARPQILLNELNLNFYTVDGVNLHSSLSFPSGHTSSAFSLFFAIAVLCKKPWQKCCCLILACLAGYSRIYLSQHFLQDVLAGSVIGIISVIIAAYWFTTKQFGEKNILYYLKKEKNGSKKECD